MCLLNDDDHADSSLWTMAVDYATWIYKHVPSMHTGIAPIELMCHSIAMKKELDSLTTMHTWNSLACADVLSHGHKILPGPSNAKDTQMVLSASIRPNIVCEVIYS